MINDSEILYATKMKYVSKALCTTAMEVSSWFIDSNNSRSALAFLDYKLADAIASRLSV
jgi:hypothetical protein